ncbi:MAG: histidine-type phosphatase [Muribaculaceae bacterium]|nr:histidine-type phosphatase [Muribaculaceae bacterium]
MRHPKIFSLIAGLFLSSGFAYADTLQDVDLYEAGGNYYCYPWLNQIPPSETPAPEGYEPFHLEHYSRHGSRWHIGNGNYDIPYEILTKAKAQGKLTPLGEKVLSATIEVRDEFKKGRDGELSDKGAWQHQGIGKRMAKRYPQIFNPEANIDARSTIVIRSILSMFNGLNGIKSVVPEIAIKTDASEADMWYMNYSDTLGWKIKSEADRKYLWDFEKRHENKGEYLSKIFNDPVYARDSVGAKLFNPLFSLLVNTQSHSDQPWLMNEVFSEEEARERWLCRNANWFFQGGNSALTDHHMPFSQANLLVNIIESADSAVVSPKQSANLRYGHDTIIMPLTCLLELDGFGEEINDLEELGERGWHDYMVVPMGANIQIVFYRPKADAKSSPDEVLVKVLLNEKECTLPLDRENGPYYKWTDFRKYYLDKINKEKERV